METFIELFIFLTILTVSVKSEIESSNTALETNYPLRKESKINYYIMYKSFIGQIIGKLLISLR